MKEDRYRKLAEHLDQLPGGFAPSDTGADLHLLQRLFTEKEAELATHLTLNREGARAIARRAGLPLTETEQRLAEMAHKGLIFSIHPEDGPTLYQAVPWGVIFDFQVNIRKFSLVGFIYKSKSNTCSFSTSSSPNSMNIVRGILWYRE